MDNISSNRMQPVVRKAKKKQVKDELDRIKQLEKKKRRLEKALATSAAICSELEKKKQMKKEEQQRLDEEGAAIAEAVALRVLLGEEDSDDFNGWDCANKADSFGGIGWVSEGCGSGCDWGNGDWSCYSGSYGSDQSAQYLDGGWGGAGFSAAGLMAAQAISSLHIADDSCVDTIVFDGMLRG